MIIGITGTLGAGKGTVVEYLETKGFTHCSARAFFAEELERRNVAINRDTLTETANDLRTTFGLTYVMENLLERAKAAGGDAVIESVRTPTEAQFLKEHGALLWAVDADRKTRYERIYKRGSATDNVSFEKFVEDEDREMHNTDPAKQSIGQVMKIADQVLLNDGTQEELFAQVEAALRSA